MRLKVAPRLYQQTILGTCVASNTLVVLPTGLGKTLIALMLACARLRDSDKKMVFVSPTKPLVEQHARTFIESVEIDADAVVVLTGSIPVAKRQKLFSEKQIIFSTPQGLENDVMAKRISLDDVGLFVFDEAHRAVGDYAYVYLASAYIKTRDPHILALTASPGSNMDKIMEVVDNLHIADVEIRSKEDADVKPYVQDVAMQWVPVTLPETFSLVLQHLRDCRNNKFIEMKELGYSKSSSLNKFEMLKLQGRLQAELGSGDRSFELLKSLSLIAEAMKVEHAIELVESQGIPQLISYFDKLEEDARTTRVKAVKNLIMDPLFLRARACALELSRSGAMHPKIERLKDILAKEKDEKHIVFTQYRASAQCIAQALEGISSCEVFVGQAKKNGLGLSQKEQVAMLDRFRGGEFSTLIATSVAEEGLDIPKVDSVVFFEPIPSAIRSIQRRGRTGRNDKGAVRVLMSKGTRDEAYRWSAHHKEKAMMRNLLGLKERLKKRDVQQSLDGFSGSEEIRFIVDHRERGSGVMKALLGQGCQLELQQLPIGDYLLSGRTCVEFKTVPDFVSSIIDGRLFEQLKAMKSHFSKPLLIIQGEENMYSQRNVHPNAIRGALSTIAVQFGIPLLQTRNAHETSELLLQIAKKEQASEGKTFGVHGNKKPLSTKEHQAFIVSSLPGIGWKSAKPLLEHFGSVRSVLGASEEELCSVDGVGAVRAKRIVEALDAQWEKE